MCCCCCCLGTEGNTSLYLSLFLSFSSAVPHTSRRTITRKTKARKTRKKENTKTSVSIVFFFFLLRPLPKKKIVVGGSRNTNKNKNYREAKKIEGTRKNFETFSFSSVLSIQIGILAKKTFILTGQKKKRRITKQPGVVAPFPTLFPFSSSPSRLLFCFFFSSSRSDLLYLSLPFFICYCCCCKPLVFVFVFVFCFSSALYSSFVTGYTLSLPLSNCAATQVSDAAPPLSLFNHFLRQLFFFYYYNYLSSTLTSVNSLSSCFFFFSFILLSAVTSRFSIFYFLSPSLASPSVFGFSFHIFLCSFPRVCIFSPPRRRKKR